MNKLNRYLPDQRFLILLNRFIVRSDESDCNKEKIVKDAYLFCIGYFLKYQQDYHNPYLDGPSNIIAVLNSVYLVLTSTQYRLPSVLNEYCISINLLSNTLFGMNMKLRKFYSTQDKF